VLPSFRGVFRAPLPDRTHLPRRTVDPLNEDGRKAVASVIATNADHGVTWVHSYVTPDRKQTFCVYDGPAPEAIRKVAERNGLPIGRITGSQRARPVLLPFLTLN